MVLDLFLERTSITLSLALRNWVFQLRLVLFCVRDWDWD